jgi:Ethanolamine utilization protein EutJ (predicted chaperonin)
VISFALGAELDDARVKDRALPWQRIVIALGLVVAATRWLAGQLGERALHVRIAFPPALLAEERAIVALLLEAEVTAGTVSVADEPLAVARDAAMSDTVAIRADYTTWPEWTDAAEDLLRQLV